MADAKRLIALGVPTELAKELAIQIDAGPAPAAEDVTVDTFTTAGGTEISGDLQAVIEAVADLADPA